MRPSVDVHVPNRDYGRWLPACLDSVLTQDGVDVRVVVVDNASKDDSVAVVEAYAERDRRVSLVRHAQDQGLIASLSEGLAWCSAEYTVNLSADDRLTPGSLARATAFMAQRPDAGLVYGPAVLHREGTAEPRIVQRGPLPRTWSGSRWLAQVARTGKNPVFSPEALVRTGPRAGGRLLRRAVAVPGLRHVARPRGARARSVTCSEPARPSTGCTRRA
jgi:glycosyltransferase involved in cell wall biosynthesis